MVNVLYPESPMARIVHPRMPDGTILIARRHDPKGKPKGVALLLPDLGEDLTALDSAAEALAAIGITAYAVVARGHGLSGGTWSLAGHLRDMRAWLHTLRDTKLPVLLIARGLSATLALLHEEIAHRKAELVRPAVPDGMILLDPVMHGSARLPQGFLAAWQSRVGACRSISRQERKILHRFVLPPVRVQTPTTVVVSHELHSEDKDDPLRRIFGSARVLRGQWLHPSKRLDRIVFDREIVALSEELLAHEDPHRFQTNRS